MKKLSHTPKFNDPNFEQLVRINLNKFEGEITNEDIAELYYISNEGIELEISDITGIEYCVELRSLFIGNYNANVSGHYISHSISDLSPLVDLPKMKALFLQGCKIKNIRPLSSLIGLERLDLSQNYIDDISLLSNLEKLEYLSLRETKFNNINQLMQYANLKELDLASNDYETGDLRPLEKLIGLEALCLYGNKINNISFLSELVNLRRTFLNYNQIDDLSTLRTLIHLEFLRLDNNKINDISQLNGLVNLKFLALDNNQISDVTPLSGLPQLEELWLLGTLVTDLSPVAHVKNLHVEE